MTKAFTIIELLVVISIISVLLSIILPALSKARRAAKDLTCLTGARQTGLAVTTYTSDYRSYFPNINLSGYSLDANSWLFQIYDYMNLPAPATTSWLAFCAEGYEAVQCPYESNSLYPTTGKRYNYGINVSLRIRYDLNVSDPTTWFNRSWRMEDLAHAQLTGLIVDTGVYDADNYPNLEQYSFKGHPGGRDVMAPLHNGYGITVTFVDGHGKFVSADSQYVAKADSPWRGKKFWTYNSSGYNWATFD